jgi:hypothetical protein
MANPACDAFSSIDQVLAQANMGQLNITTFVASCPQTCTLAWGTGNPDLSGIGANISYILQAVLTFIFCPLFCLLYWCLNRWEISKDTKDKLETLQDTFLDISAQFSIPVAVAAVIRFHQHAPFYELAFLRSLTTMQFLSLLSSTVTSGIFQKRKSPLRIGVLVAYGLLEFGLYMGLIGNLREGKKSWEILSELGQACKAYNQIEPWIQNIPTRPPGVLAHVTAENFFDLFSKKHWKEALVELALAIAGIIGLFVAIGIIVVLVLVLIGRDVRLLGAMSLAFTVGMLVEVVEMERTRNVMKTVTGAEFQDNQWGFGQVISLFLWAPLCLQSFYQIFCEFASFMLIQIPCFLPFFFASDGTQLTKASGPPYANSRC